MIEEKIGCLPVGLITATDVLLPWVKECGKKEATPSVDRRAAGA